MKSVLSLLALTTSVVCMEQESPSTPQSLRSSSVAAEGAYVFLPVGVLERVAEPVLVSVEKNQQLNSSSLALEGACGQALKREAPLARNEILKLILEAMSTSPLEVQEVGIIKKTCDDESDVLISAELSPKTSRLVHDGSVEITTTEENGIVFINVESIKNFPK